MPAPTPIAYSESNWGVGTAKATASFTWQTGDRFVILGFTEDNGGTLTTPSTTGSGLSFAALAGTPTNIAGTCKAFGWTAAATANGSGTITSTAGGAFGGIAVWQYRGSDGVATPTLNASTTKTVSVLRGQNNSAVVFAAGDFSGVAVTGYSYTPAGATDRHTESFGSIHYSIYVADWGDQGAAGTTAYGITGTSSTGNHNKIAVEVFGSAAAAAARPPQIRSQYRGRW